MRELRCSDADREATIRVLHAGHTDGRIDDEELEARVAAAWRARLVADLDALVRDLPRSAPRAAAAVPPTRIPTMPGRRPFSVRWRAPGGPDRATAALLDHVAPALSTLRYDLQLRTADRVVFARRRLLSEDRIAIEILPDGDGTMLYVHGTGPLSIRRAFARLED